MNGLFNIGGQRQSDSRCNRAGLSLVELLIVVAVIGLISGLAIPVMYRMGLFSGNKVELATRELYSALRAAKIYAATHNVDTGIAYAGLVGVDETMDSYTGQDYPIVDAYATVRRLKREEVEHLPVVVHPSTVPISDGYPELYVYVGDDQVGFVDMPRETCLLPDIFQLTLGSLNTPSTGLEGIVIVQKTIAVDAQGNQRQVWECAAPRNDFVLDAIPPQPMQTNPNFLCGSYPAHIFTPAGELRVPSDGLPQRLSLRVGLLPNETPDERFTVDPATVPDSPEFKEQIFIQFAASQPQLYTLIRHPDPSLSETEYVDNDRRITLYRSQGRIKIEP